MAVIELLVSSTCWLWAMWLVWVAVGGLTQVTVGCGVFFLGDNSFAVAQADQLTLLVIELLDGFVSFLSALLLVPDVTARLVGLGSLVCSLLIGLLEILTRFLAVMSSSPTLSVLQLGL